MFRPLAIQGVEDVMNSVNRFAKEMGVDLLQELKTTGRTLAVSLAHSTQPYGMKLDAKRSGESAVEKDIRKVFGTPSSIYEDLDIKDETAAGQFWRAFTEKDTSRMLEIVQQEGLYIQQITHTPSASLHEAHRKAKGRVYLKMQRGIVLDSKALNAYIKTRQKKVGFAKAGWARAAEILGGLRGFGSWASTRHPGAAGGADISEDPYHPMVTIHNSVSYIRDTLPESEVNKAVAIAYQKLFKRMNIILRKKKKKL